MPETISVGNNVRIDDFCCLVGGEKGIKIGSNIHIAFFSILLGNGGIEMDDFSGLSSRCSIYSASDDYSGATMTNPTVPAKYKNVTVGKVHIGKHSLVGTNSTILPNVDIPEGCSIGANSLVTKSLEPWGIYVGVPVKRVKNRLNGLLELEKSYLDEVKLLSKEVEN